MELEQFARITTTLAGTHSRRTMLRRLGASALGAGGLSLFFSESEAKRRRKDKRRKKKDQPALEPDVAVTSITVETTAEAAHDNVVVQFINNGTQTATGFRIGMTATRSDGTVRAEVFSTPQTLAPGVFGVVSFRLGCSWLNNGTGAARAVPSPLPGESNANATDNLRTVTFGSNVCS